MSPSLEAYDYINKQDLGALNARDENNKIRIKASNSIV